MSKAGGMKGNGDENSPGAPDAKHQQRRSQRRRSSSSGGGVALQQQGPAALREAEGETEGGGQQQVRERVVVVSTADSGPIPTPTTRAPPLLTVSLHPPTCQTWLVHMAGVLAAVCLPALP